MIKRVIEKAALCTVLAALFMACDKSLEDKPEQALTSLQVTLSNFKENAGTRAQESGYQTSFANGDQIGVFALKSSGSVILEDNIPYTYNGASWSPANATNQIHTFGGGITYYAYYPYSSSMSGKKSIAEITAAFTPAQDQSDYTKYTSADLMTATGTLSGSSLSLAFTHAMSLIEIEIEETTNSTAPYDPAPLFHGMNPWKMQDKIYRYLVRPGIATTVTFDYGPADNRYAFQKSLTAGDITAGRYIRIKAPYRNWCVELNTGNYAAALGPVSKVIINGTEYAATKVNGSNSKYVVEGLRKIPASFTSFDVYITDNLAKADSKEQLLVSANIASLSTDASASTITLPLSAGGMEGAGTSASDPYRVTTPPQLRGVAQNTSAHYKQTENINLSIYANWQPCDYSGTYDGDHKSISNLTCNGEGLFKRLSGTIKNTHITSGSITNGGTAGAICGACDPNGIIESCSNAATITGTKKGVGFFGGICGELKGKAFHCKNMGTILGTGEIFGGVIGWVNSGTLQYSYNAGEVKPNEPYHAGKPSGVGGIAGAIYYGSPQLSYCYNSGVVKHYPNESTSGGGNIMRGEIVGWTQGDGSVNNNWYMPGDGNKPAGDNAVNNTNKAFDNASNVWPAYSIDPSNGWGSSHWKSYSQGQYPKLLWERTLKEIPASCLSL